MSSGRMEDRNAARNVLKTLGYRWRSRRDVAKGLYPVPSGMSPSVASRPASVQPSDFANGIRWFSMQIFQDAVSLLLTEHVRKAPMQSAGSHHPSDITDVSIVYHRDDRMFAARIATVLQRSGITVWTSPEYLVSGAMPFLEVQTLFSKSKIVLYLMSPSVFEINWAQKEQSAAFSRHIAEKKRYWYLLLLER